MGLEEKLPGCRGIAQQQQISVSVFCIRISMAFSKYKIVTTTVFMHRTKGEKNTTKILLLFSEEKNPPHSQAGCSWHSPGCDQSM